MRSVVGHRNGEAQLIGRARRDEAGAYETGADVLLKYVQLTDITTNAPRTEASLRNQMTNGKIRLRKEAPYNTFEVKDPDGQVILKGKVKDIERRSVEVNSL